MAKDKIFEETRLINPLVLLANGKKKIYAQINIGEIVLVRDSKHSSSFIEGKVLKWKYPRKVWTYEVETKNGIGWCYPYDFKVYHKNH